MQRDDTAALAEYGRALVDAKDRRSTWRPERQVITRLQHGGASAEMAEQCAEAMRQVASVIRTVGQRAA